MGMGCTFFGAYQENSSWLHNRMEPKENQTRAVSKWRLYWEIMVMRFSGCTCIACLLHVMRDVLNNSGIWEAYFAVKLGRSTVQSEDAAL
ncbi:hypothetical protein VPH35_015301 [Triticum aestivum]|uniref:Uncharacterized protein n=1 Tax=Aegilops tauschii TaxID=37682 RepID=M8BD95_AEGTA